MRVLLVSATKQEVSRQYFPNTDVLISGLGMINTCFNLSKKVLQNKYDLVINMGIAGTFNNNLKIGDVVEVIEDGFSELGFENGIEFCYFSDNEVKNSYIVEPRTDLQKVKAITVNTVHGNEKSISKIIDRINPDIETMEGASFFHVCQALKIPCVQIRAISNRVEKRNKENWDIPLAIENLNREVAHIIAKL